MKAFAILIAVFAISTPAMAIEFNPVADWVFTRPENDPGLASFFGDAKFKQGRIVGVFTLKDPKTDSPPLVLVREITLPRNASLPRTKADWMAIVKVDAMGALSVQTEMHFTKSNYYLLIVDEDQKLNRMVPSAILGLVSKGKVYLFSYTHAREVFAEDKALILGLYSQIQVAH